MATVTPSKVAASALESISLSNKVEAVAEPNLLAKLKAAAAVEAGIKVDAKDAAKEVPVEQKEIAKLSDAELRKRFVGDIHCEEKDEPILQESLDRFVLFPIRYREVSHLVCRACLSDATRPLPV